MGRVTINTGGTHSFVRESQDRRGDPSYRPYKLINNEKVFYETIHDIIVYYDYGLGEKRYFGFVEGSKVYYDSDKAMGLLNETSNAEFKKWVHNQKKKRVAIESSMQHHQKKRVAIESSMQHHQKKRVAIESSMQHHQEEREEEQHKFWKKLREREKTQKKKKLIFPILLAAVLLIVAIGTALYLILN